jgi:Pin2-interacting protein X1
MLGIGMQHQKDPNGIAWRQNRDFENLLRRLNNEGTVVAEGEVPGMGMFHKAREGGGEEEETAAVDDANGESATKREKKKKKKVSGKKRKAVEGEEEDNAEKEGLDDKKQRKKRRKSRNGDDQSVPDVPDMTPEIDASQTIPPAVTIEPTHTNATPQAASARAPYVLKNPVVFLVVVID